MKRVPEIFQEKEHTYSIELFPPKTDKGFENLKKTIAQICELKPDYFSCTYGAGGGSREKTFDIVEHIQQNHAVAAVAHLTCVLHTKTEILALLEELKRRSINNVLALRGDPPQDYPDWMPGHDNFKYSSELCAFIRENFGDYFGIGVAGFPEGHIMSPDRDEDARHLKAKIDAGADYVITQLFFNNQDYFDYMKRLRALNVKARIIPGILPIVDYDRLLQFCQVCGATITEEIHSIFKPIRDSKELMLEAGIKFAIDQCRELLNNGAPGLHFYALNKVHPADVILNEVRI